MPSPGVARSGSPLILSGQQRALVSTVAKEQRGLGAPRRTYGERLHFEASGSIRRVQNERAMKCAISPWSVEELTSGDCQDSSGGRECRTQKRYSRYALASPAFRLTLAKFGPGFIHLSLELTTEGTRFYKK